MAKCDVCAKEAIFGNNRSHAENKTSRIWKPNVRKIRVMENGSSKTVNACTRCIRSNKVTRKV